jgi:hypothetical protein
VYFFSTNRYIECLFSGQIIMMIRLMVQDHKVYKSSHYVTLVSMPTPRDLSM